MIEYTVQRDRALHRVVNRVGLVQVTFVSRRRAQDWADVNNGIGQENNTEINIQDNLESACN